MSSEEQEAVLAPSEAPTDEELMARVRDKRDAEAHCQLRGRYSGKTRVYCGKRLYGNDDANDVNQEVWIKVWTRAEIFREGEKFSPWMWTITSNTVNDWLRKRLRDPSVPLEGSGEHVDDTIDERVALVEDALNSLPPEDQRILRGRYWEGHTLEDLAKQLGISEPTLRDGISNALERFRRFWEEWNESP